MWKSILLFIIEIANSVFLSHTQSPHTNIGLYVLRLLISYNRSITSIPFYYKTIVL